MKKIFLSPPHMSGREMKYIEQAFDQNWIAPLGPNVDGFEEAISNYCGSFHVAALNSGTAAIHLALILLGIKEGDEVIASTFTFSATINPIVYLGAHPILVDSEPETWNMDPALLEQAIKDRITKGKKPKAIVLVHLYGMPARMDEILKISDQYDIPVIEDAAEALGSKYKGKLLGTFGRFGVFSFNGNKILNTSGGGALVSNEKSLIDKARYLATQARDPAPYYQHSEIGYNYRMSNVIAGLGRGQMEVINERIKARRNNYLYYKDALASNQQIDFLEEPDDSFYSNHWLTTVLIKSSETDPKSPLEIQKELDKVDIETRPLWKPMHLQPVFFRYKCYSSGVSESLFRDGLCLPSGSQLSTEEMDRIIENFTKVLSKG